MNLKLKRTIAALALTAAAATGTIATTATAASAATNCGGTGGLYPDDCYHAVYYGGAYHSGNVSYSAGWSGRILVKDSASDRGACTYLQTRTKASNGSWSGWSNSPAVCGGRSAYVTPSSFYGGDVQLRLTVPGVGTGATVSCNRGSDGAELCR